MTDWDEPDDTREPAGPDDRGEPARAGWGADPELNPAQQAVVDLLGVHPDEIRQFDAGFRHEVRAELEAGLEPLLGALGSDDQLFVGKYPLAQVHGCEAKYLADRRGQFAWTPASARGTVSHKAIELSVHWKGEPTPLLLVDEAMARLSQGSGSLADFLQTISLAEQAELRGAAGERVTKFLECFPPLKPQWRPVTESSVRVELFEQRIVLGGRVDLTLGKSSGTTARKLLIDFKSGGFSPSHVEDLRYYALLETVRMGTPPRLLATYYLDTGRPHPEAVSEGLVDAAVQRTIDGVTRMVELEFAEAEPRKRPGPACRWCPLAEDCAEGRAWLAGRDEELGGYEPDED